MQSAPNVSGLMFLDALPREARTRIDPLWEPEFVATRSLGAKFALMARWRFGSPSVELASAVANLVSTVDCSAGPSDSEC